MYKASFGRKLVGWNSCARYLKEATNFWHKVWDEAGCPSSGVLFKIKRCAKSRYKYAVRRLQRRQRFILQDKLAHSFAMKRKDRFWSDIRHLNRSSKPCIAPVIDGVSGSGNIANMFASKYGSLLNKHSSSSRDSLYSSVQSSMTASHLCAVDFSYDDVLEALCQLKSKKSDPWGISSEHLKLASPVISEPLAIFFTAVLRHGYMPQTFRDCVLIPIPKGNKDASCSHNYRAIALASSLSKVLERLILLKYATCFSSNLLQFGFKSGFSTSLCTGVVKSVISRYIHNGSVVLGCFLDASKAFDMVDHGILFQTLLDRGLPLPLLRFMLSWYSTQQMQVRWGSCLSQPFSVSNGVRQGSVLSPVLFAMYLDGLLSELSNCGVGCYWGCLFAGAFCYADDIVLLAPCASALRIMLDICNSYATSHGLEFNASKTQLICFRTPSTRPCTASISFGNTPLQYSKQVTHLGHILTCNLQTAHAI